LKNSKEERLKTRTLVLKRLSVAADRENKLLLKKLERGNKNLFNLLLKRLQKN
jgi:hypothetical protein